MEKRLIHQIYRKFAFLLTIFVLILCLAACDPESFNFNYDELKEEVIEVELISYNNFNVDIINKFEGILPFDFTESETIEKLNFENLDDFLKDLTEIEFLVFFKTF